MSRYTFTEGEIKQVEEILINWNKFCIERRKVLENFDDNIGVQAVPWSWKTTLLVAKLFLLAQRINFENEAVCILTHTNVAVDEIKKKVKKAKLNNNVEKTFIDNIERILKFPNYIWTLQSFVDKYLAIPWYIEIYWKRPSKIDDGYVEQLLKRLFYDKLSNDTKKWISYIFVNGKNSFKWYDTWLSRLYKTYFKQKWNNWELVFKKSQIYQEIKISVPPKTKKQQDRYNDIFKVKIEQIVDNWYLTFQEANYFAENYFNSHNLLIRRFINNRFQFIFLDEIQDTNWIHINLLNEIFFKSNCLIQWFWDKNQAILNWDNDEWYLFKLFDNNLEITSSKRLSKEIANWVWKCSINPLELDGIESRNIPIYFYIYDNSSKNKILDFYKEKIEEHKEKWTSLYWKNWVFKIIWRTHNWIKEYFPSYEWKEKIRKDYFLDYFQKIDDLEFKKEGFKIYKDNILEAIIRFCNLSWIKNWDKWFSKMTFLKYLKDNNEDYLNEMLINIYIWAQKINNLNFLSQETDKEIKEFLWRFEKDWIKLNLEDNFLNSSKNYPLLITSYEENWTNSEANPAFEYWSIHWIKWETHTWTLILDIKFKHENNKRILEYINDDSIKNDKWDDIKDSIKLYYVWMTRATHLLIIWINKSLYKNWNIDFLYNYVNKDNIFPQEFIL